MGVVESRSDEPDDERLRRLLDVEQRLQAAVRTASEEAARRLAAARDAGERRLDEARQAAVRADSEQARADATRHRQALAAIEAAASRTVADLAGVSDARLDELARRALARAIGDTGERP